MKHLWNALRRQGDRLTKGWVAMTALLLGLQLLMAAPALAATTVQDIPNISTDSSNWIADEAELLSPLVKRNINQTLSNIAKETGNEIRMVTVRGLNYGVTPQSFTDELFTAWFPDTVQGNQTLMVVDAKTKDAGIRVGKTSQADIPEAFAQSLTSESLLIPIRNGNYNQAFQETAARAAAVLSGETDPGPPVTEIAQLPERNYKTSEETNDFNSTIIVVVLLVIATVVPMVTFFIYQGQ
ncbi:MAG: TPM domain-containing protein [Thermosynechococcaceae cyanobacterium]